MNIEEVKKLADLARIEISDQEAEKLGKEMESILAYVQDVKNVVKSGDEIVENAFVRNVLREDSNIHESGVDTEQLLSNAPASENGYIKTKKILPNQEDIN